MIFLTCEVSTSLTGDRSHELHSLTTPFAWPVASELQESPSGAEEKHMALTAGRHTAEAAGEPFTENRERRERLSPPTSEEEQETVAKSPEVLQRRISCQIQKKTLQFLKLTC